MLGARALLAALVLGADVLPPDAGAVTHRGRSSTRRGARAERSNVRPFSSTSAGAEAEITVARLKVSRS